MRTRAAALHTGQSPASVLAFPELGVVLIPLLGEAKTAAQGS